MASMHPTEAEYTAAMERHGTPDWSADDQRVMDRYLAHRRGEVVDDKPKLRTTAAVEKTDTAS